MTWPEALVISVCVIVIAPTLLGLLASLLNWVRK